MGDGSVGAPAVSFTADTNTGIHHPAADTLGMAAGGTERVRVTTTGLQLGGLSLGFGTGTGASDTYLMRDDGANLLA